jgi:hypothetical protein
VTMASRKSVMAAIDRIVPTTRMAFLMTDIAA